MDRWEYKNEIFPTSEISFIDFLNINGKDGWEYIESETFGKALVCIFKRKIQQENE